MTSNNSRSRLAGSSRSIKPAAWSGIAADCVTGLEGRLRWTAGLFVQELCR